MKVYKQKFAVRYEYPVYFTRGIFRPGNLLLASVIRRGKWNGKCRVIVWIDSGVVDAVPRLPWDIEKYFKRHAGHIDLARRPMTTPGGENAKNGWNGVRDVMTALGREHMCRKSFVIAIGGGSVLDMVGFAASLVHRGVRVIRIPTTVLAQNDAGIGVKTGMNEGGAKNFAGTFAPPFAVINDFEFLRTLDDMGWTGGIAEAFKVAMIKDRKFFDFLCRNAGALKRRDQRVMERLVEKCAILHLEHIRTAGDPFEMGSARPLDFGHWAAHKLEVMSEFTLGHGQAVAIGIALDSYYAMRRGLISRRDLEKVITAFMNCGLPIWHPLLERQNRSGEFEVLGGLEDFREHLGGKLCITLPGPIGRKLEVNKMQIPLIVDGIRYLRNFV